MASFGRSDLGKRSAAVGSNNHFPVSALAKHGLACSRHTGRGFSGTDDKSWSRPPHYRRVGGADGGGVRQEAKMSSNEGAGIDGRNRRMEQARSEVA